MTSGSIASYNYSSLPCAGEPELEGSQFCVTGTDEYML